MNTSSRSSVQTLVGQASASLLSVAFLCFASGCAGQHVTHTGFIPDATYARMTHVKDHTDDLVYVNPQMDPRKYQFVAIDPVVWQPVANAPHLSAQAQARMTAAFQTELAAAFRHDLRPATPEACGPCTNAIHIRAAITNIRRSKWYYNAIPVVAGFGAGAFGGGLPPIPPPAPGGASEELLATDAVSGELLIAVATYNNGMPWNMMGQWLPYAHAKRAFHLASLLLDDEFRKAGQAERGDHTAVASSK
ncbi:DUF3313 family protein [Tanticharoenia sakaeratensis]|nr:DUF3313 family protein [Tanticharoenia sakaeratensis]